MNDVALHPLPRWGAVVSEQFRAVGIALRRELLGAMALILGITAMLSLSRFRGEWTEPVRMSPDEVGFVLGLIGLLFPLAVWKSEGPSNRGYFWSLPLPRDRHTLVKVFTGWAWLMIALLALMSWVSVHAWLTGGGPGLDETRLVFAPGAVPSGTAPGNIAEAFGGAVDPALLREVHYTTAAWMWLVPLVAPTVAYLFGSIAALRADHAWLWLAAPFIAFGLLGAFADMGNVRILAEVGQQIAWGTYSIETLLTGSNEYALHLRTTTGEDVRVWGNLAQASQWFATALIWGAPALAGVLFATFRRQER